MLGRLLSSASSAATSPSATRPSTAVGHEGEDYYTKTLLYPDSISLSNSQSLSGSGFISSSGSSTDWEGIDIDPSRDVRILIAQDGNGSSDAKSILYDSKPGTNFSGPNSRNYPNTFSSFDEFAAPLSPGLGGFSRRRRSPMHYSSYPTSTTVAPKDEWTVFTDCMFGSMAMSYKGTSTKLHILPTLASDKSGASTPVSDGRQKGKGVPAPLGPQCQPSPYGHPPALNSKDRKSVLITRLFSVAIPSPGTVNFAPPPSNDHTPTPSGSIGNLNGFPFPKMTPSQQASQSKPIKSSKSSMYAIGLVISLPAPSSMSTKRCPHCFTLQYESDTRRASNGEFCCDIAAATVDDEQRTDSVCVEISQESGIADEQMELITKHWDIITRSLNDLQIVAQSRIADGLRSVGVISPNTSQKYRRKIDLRPGALMYDEMVRNEVERFKWRIVSGIKIPRVVTGQGRWSSWRDEARLINKRFGGKEQKFLFLTLLTAFLGHHTEWLDVLGPARYRRAHQLQKQASNLTYEDSSLPSRTIVISNDKIIARKLIYLLSAFLPTKTVPSWSELDASYMPTRISSSTMLSQSPPVMSFMSRSSKDSLRRRPRRRPSKLSMMHGDANDEGAWDMPMDLGATGGTSLLQHHHLDSSLQLPVQALGSVRKASTTIHPAPVATTAATKYGDLSLKESRPESSGSSASFSLVHVLRRSGTGNTSTDSSGTGTSGWGFLSHIWPHQRGSTRCTTETTVSHHDDVLESPNIKPSNAAGISEKYDDEAVVQDHDLYPGYDDSILSPPRFDPAYFHRAFHQEAPLNYSIGEDGVVDVEVPVAPMSSMNPTVFGNSTGNSASPIGSPGSVSYNFSLLSLDRSSLSLPSSFLHSTEEGQEPATNVAGWMEDERFHPDFTLQAIKPYTELETDIKHSMRMEPTPKKNVIGDGLTDATQQTDDWVKVCSTLIADTKSCTIRKLTLLRRRLPVENLVGSRASPISATSILGSSIPSSFMLHRRRSSTATFIPVEEDLTAAEEERFEDELVMDMDDILATAVERAIGVEHETHASGNNHTYNGHAHQSHQLHQAGLRTPSRGGPTSTAGKNKVSFSREPSVPNTPEYHGSCTLGSECKSLVLGALEEVVRRCVAAVDLKEDSMAPTKGPVMVENVLTEGVEAWLNAIKGY